MNLFIGIGRLGENPVGKKFVNPNTNKEEDVANFSIAIDDGYGKYKRVEWVNCVCYGTLAKSVCQYMRKGGLIAVVGKIRKTSYKDRNGQNVYKTEVIVKEQKFLVSDRSANEGVPTPEDPKSAENLEENTLPSAPDDSFVDVPEGLEQDLPFR